MQKMRYRYILILFTIIVVSIVFFLNINNVIADSGENGTMTVEVNLIGFSGPSGSQVEIEVPDYIFLGNVTKNELVSDEVRVEINNTGKVDVIVTPLLADSSEDIFSYLFFRSGKTSNGTEIIPKKIGEYSLNITKPSSGELFNDAHCYMMLNLTNYPDTINQDILGYRKDIVFFAMPK